MALEDDLRQLAQLDRRVVRALVEGDVRDFMSAIKAYLEVRKRLRELVLDESVLTLEDPEIAEILRRFSGAKLPTDELLVRLEVVEAGSGPLREFNDDELWGLGST